MSGPWLQAAVLCERVSVDEGRVAALGLVERVVIEGGATVALQLVVAVVRDGWREPIAVGVVVRDPAGAQLATVEVEHDPPDEAGAAAQVVMPLELVPGDEGLYWFDVTLRGRLVTRVPLRVLWKTSPER